MHSCGASTRLQCRQSILQRPHLNQPTIPWGIHWTGIGARALDPRSDRAAKYQPQAAYAGLQKSLQAKWQYLQRVTANILDKFDPLTKAIQSTFLPALFGQSPTEEITKITELSVKQAGLALPCPTNTAGDNYKNSTVTCGHLIAALRHRETFRHADHTATMAECRSVLKERNNKDCEERLQKLLQQLPPQHSRTILRGRQTGSWLTTMPSDVCSTELSPQEFRDGLHLRYGIDPPNLPARCDGCNAPYLLQHGLTCKTGGLIIARHNEVQDELLALCTKAFPPSCVRYEPLIHPS